MCTDYDTAPYYWFTRNNPGPMNVAASALLEVLLAHSADVNDQDKVDNNSFFISYDQFVFPHFRNVFTDVWYLCSWDTPHWVWRQQVAKWKL